MSKYNVLFITIDSLNRDFFGCYNEKSSSENLTPNLDEWSKKCITFSSAFSSSVKTSVSFLSILSGCYPCRYRDWYDIISDNRTIISEVLNMNGYYTYGFTSNPCTSTLRKYDKGFQLFEDNLLFKNMHGKNLALMLALKTLFRDPYYSADKINSQIFSRFDKSRTPFFMWIHYMDVHGPYISRTGWQLKNRISSTRLWKKAQMSSNEVRKTERRKMINNYKEKIRYLDYHIAELIREIDDNNTITIITADHGDMFGERGYFGHPYLFYNEMINVPLFIKLPSEMKIANRLFKHPVSLMDIVPTIIDILKLKAQNDFDGHSLMPIMTGDKKYPNRSVISEVSREYACLIKAKWKLIANYTKSSFELYNLEEDFEEKNNLFDKGLDIAQELNDILLYHIQRHCGYELDPAVHNM